MRWPVSRPAARSAGWKSPSSMAAACWRGSSPSWSRGATTPAGSRASIPGGSDLVYLATDFCPYLLTLFPGVWALRRAGKRRGTFAFGFWLPFALAPFLALTGDAYEIGSILVTATSWWQAEVLRGDDLFRLVSELRAAPGAPWGGVLLGFLLGALWAFATYAAGSWIADRLGQRQGDEIEML